MKKEKQWWLNDQNRVMESDFMMKRVSQKLSFSLWENGQMIKLGRKATKVNIQSEVKRNLYCKLSSKCFFFVYWHTYIRKN